MRKLQLYSLSPNSGYGGCAKFKNLKFYDFKDNEIPITDLSTVNNAKTATFKLNGVSATLTIPKTYGSTYYARYTLLNNGFAMFQTQNTAEQADKGIIIEFADEIVGIKKVSIDIDAATYSSKDWVGIIDDGDESKPSVLSGSATHIIELNYKVRCMLGKNGNYYFLKEQGE